MLSGTLTFSEAKVIDRGRMMKRILFALLVSAIVASVALPHAIEQYKTGDQAARFARKVFAKSIEVIMAERRRQCMAAIGNLAFCDCINGYLPMPADFQTYIKVTTASREGSFEQMTSDDKTIVDAVLTTRNRCVEKVFGNPR
jgi:hypothetical protein